MKRCMKKIAFLVIALVLIAIPVFAAGGRITATAQAPTKNADGTPISYWAGDYALYWVAGNCPNPLVLSAFPNKELFKGALTGTLTYTTTAVLNPGTYCLVMTATNTIPNESGPSNSVPRDVVDNTKVPEAPIFSGAIVVQVP